MAPDFDRSGDLSLDGLTLNGIESVPMNDGDDLMIDLFAPCGEESCNHSGVSSSEFLEGFTGNLPEVGKQVLLRVHGSTVPGLLLRRCGNEH